MCAMNHRSCGVFSVFMSELSCRKGLSSILHFVCSESLSKFVYFFLLILCKILSTVRQMQNINGMSVSVSHIDLYLDSFFTTHI